MNVTLNGQPETLPEEITVSELIARMGRDPSGKGVAVAVNGEVVPRTQWRDQRLQSDDRVELLEAVQGG